MLSQNSPFSPRSLSSIARIEPSRLRALRAYSYGMSKRFLDILCALGLLAILFPFMFLVSLVIRATSRGPAIYCQRRLTEGGKIFTMFKFRTMSCDAETETGAVWADSDDPRVTPVGRFLRCTRLDEVPQLLNVLIGDMSLVGPRPERPEFAKELADKLPSFARRLEVKAGLTGLAQVWSGYASNMDSYRKKLAWDRVYIRNRSTWLDLLIVLRTIRVVLTGAGAR